MKSNWKRNKTQKAAANTDVHTYKVYLFGIVLVTRLNSWQLLRCTGVALCRRSAEFCWSVHHTPPTPLLVAVLTSSMGNFSPNNLPPPSPGTKSAFHQHHCLSLLHRLVLLHHGNNPSIPPPLFTSHLWVSLPCVHSERCRRQFHCMWKIHDAVLLWTAQLLTADLWVTRHNNLSVGGRWPSLLASDWRAD